MIDSILSQTKEKMQKSVEVTQEDLTTIRSGRATPSLVENIVIPVYGGTAKMKLLEVATITTMDAKTIVIAPYDGSIIGEIEKGLLEANTGMTPIVDGEIIRITIPVLTEERRKEYLKLAKTKIEAGKIMLRQIRQDMMHDVKKLADEKVIDEDLKKTAEKHIQDITDQMVLELDRIGDKKESELLQL
jgi:ribosome recycling factor